MNCIDKVREINLKNSILSEIFKLSCAGTFQYANEENNTQLLNQIIMILQKEDYLEKEGDKINITDKGKIHVNNNY